MRTVRLLKHGDVVGELTVADSEAEALAQDYREAGWECVVVDAPALRLVAEPAEPAELAEPEPAQPDADQPKVQHVARALINQTLVDFHHAVRQLIAWQLETTNHWLNVGTRSVDEDVRRRELMHKSIVDLDIADRSLAVVEFQRRLPERSDWQPAVAKAEEPTGIGDILGAAAKQLLDKKTN